MKTLLALIKREYWENRGALRITPIILVAILGIGFLLSQITIFIFDDDGYSLKEALRAVQRSSDGLQGDITYQAILASSSVFTVVLMLVCFFYLLSSLYSDRKDRSILFWKSLPASDFETIASKLLTALVVAPLIFWLACIATHIIWSVLGSISVLKVGLNPLDFLPNLGSVVKGWGMILITMLAGAFWALPMFGWLMLVSAFAPRFKLLFAIAPILVVGFLQMWIKFLRTFNPFSNDNLFTLLKEWFFSSPSILTGQIDQVNRTGSNSRFETEAALGIPFDTGFEHSVTLANVFDRLFSLQMVYGLGIAAITLTATWYLRRRATES